DGDQDVHRRRQREHQVSHGHVRCRPEGEEEAEVERMPHQPVGPGVPKWTCVYGLPRRTSQTWRRPKRSKWLMRNVERSTSSQPPAHVAKSNARPGGDSTVHTSPPSGRHCHMSSASATLAKST